MYVVTCNTFQSPTIPCHSPFYKGQVHHSQDLHLMLAYVFLQGRHTSTTCPFGLRVMHPIYFSMVFHDQTILAPFERIERITHHSLQPTMRKSINKPFFSKTIKCLWLITIINYWCISCHKLQYVSCNRWLIWTSFNREPRKIYL